MIEHLNGVEDRRPRLRTCGIDAVLDALAL